VLAARPYRGPKGVLLSQLGLKTLFLSNMGLMP
jgi:hypothetical protein